jgi:hypothetical protein
MIDLSSLSFAWFINQYFGGKGEKIIEIETK